MCITNLVSVLFISFTLLISSKLIGLNVCNISDVLRIVHTFYLSYYNFITKHICVKINSVNINSFSVNRQFWGANYIGKKPTIYPILLPITLFIHRKTLSARKPHVSPKEEALVAYEPKV